MKARHKLTLSISIAVTLALAIPFLLFPASGSPLTGNGVQTAVTGPSLSPDPFPAGNPAVWDVVLVKNGGERFLETVGGEKTLALSRPVSPGPGNQTSPDVSGDRVVWTDDRAGNKDIYLSASGKAARPIANAPGDEEYPSVSGVLVAYQKETDKGNTDIYLYQANTGRTARLTTDRARQERPCVGGGIVVWEDYRDGTPAIWMYRVTAGKSIKVSGGEGPATRPRTDGKRVVWQQEGRDGMYFVRVFDIASGKTTTALPEEEAYTGKSSPAVSGGLVCYLDEYDPGRYSVELFDLRDGQRVPDPESSITQESPDISGNIVVWQQRDGRYQRVRYYLVSSKVIGSVDSSGGDQERPSTDGKSVVWQDDRDGRFQVYRAAVRTT